MNKKIKIAFASMLAVPLLACAQVRTEQTFEKDGSSLVRIVKTLVILRMIMRAGQSRDRSA